MSNIYRPNRKATDAELIRMNSVGLSLSTIANLVGCHPATISIRLKSLNIPPADTRRTFMEDVFTSLNVKQQDWLADQLGPRLSIKDFVRNLITDKYQNQTKDYSNE